MREIIRNEPVVSLGFQYKEDIKYLNESIMQLETLPPGMNIYRFMANKLGFITHSMVGLFSIHKEKMISYAQAFSGIDEISDNIIKYLAVRPEGMTFSIHTNLYKKLQSGRLFRFNGGIYKATMHTIPKNICKSLEKLIGLKNIYLIGITRNKDILGVATFFCTSLSDMSKKKLVEMLTGQFSSVFHHRMAEEEMIHIVSHDIQTPLITMNGFITELIEKYKDKMDDEGLYYLSKIKTNIHRMHRMVVSLLDISRLHTENFRHETFNTKNSIQKIVDELTLIMEREKAEVNIDDLPDIHGDRIRIEGVFRNLITNALLYKGKNIVIGHKKNLFFIQDDGIGIPTDQLERIFYPGERLEIISSEGAGMGLTFCRKVVEQHGGKIWAESRGLNKGSAFYFSLTVH